MPHLVLFRPTNLLCSAGNISDPAVSYKYILRADSSGLWQKDALSMVQDVMQPIFALGQGSTFLPEHSISPLFLVTSAISHK